MAFGDLISESNAGATGATSVSVNITVATAGSLLVCVHFTGDSDSLAPSGFTEAVAVTDSGNADQGAIYWKIAAGGEATVAPGSSVSDEHCAFVLELEGPWESSPVDQIASNDATSETTTSSGTTAVTTADDEVAVAGMTRRNGASTTSSYSNSFTGIGSQSSGGSKRVSAGYKVLTAAGTVETTITWTNAQVHMGMIATFMKTGGGGGGGGEPGDKAVHAMIKQPVKHI